MKPALWLAALLSAVMLLPWLLLRAVVGVFSGVAKVVALAVGIFCLVVALAVLGAVARAVVMLL